MRTSSPQNTRPQHWGEPPSSRMPGSLREDLGGPRADRLVRVLEKCLAVLLLQPLRLGRTLLDRVE